MKIDVFFPPAPQYKQKPLPSSGLSPQRQSALIHIAAFASIAESLVGPVPLPEGNAKPLFPATSRGFALHCLAASPFAPEMAELLGRSKLNLTAPDHVDAEHVMIIDVRKYWGVLGPIRGDVVMFADGQCAVVTQPLCNGCQNFEGVSLNVDGPPEIVKKSHWTSTLKFILRLVDEVTPLPAPAAPEPEPEPEPKPAQPEEPPANPGGKKRRLTGI